MKIGDVIYCKNKYTYDGITPHKKFKFGESYIVQDIFFDYELIRINDVIFNIKPSPIGRNLNVYFESEKDHRARKLRLLNINK